MKQVEFRKLVTSSLEKLGRFFPVYIHDRKDIYLKVKYRNPSSTSFEETLIDYVYIDSKKKRVFFVGKSQDQRDRSWFNKRPMEFSLEKFNKWATKSLDKHDQYEVYFAWNYEHKDASVFDYAPLSNVVKIEPSVEKFEWLCFEVDSAATPFTIKAKHLHESIIALDRKILNESTVD